ncbi:LpxA family transferase [Aurantimonas sp. VKM B-3413]|uniref:LpxA family transferase n=1 Tax=Aurantimonas sp. VKM B-3413 TaxID=2779401 RepID=UPI001E2F6D27|nr:LpxA family transferase [Aurantimonas sp. VKM B-3413]MCB8836977.1 LpxA family transferase [Aurantimonas sp. VKM B-3413]
MTVALADFIESFSNGPFAAIAGDAPWLITGRAREHVAGLVTRLEPDAYRVEGDIAVALSAVVEPGAVLKGPLVVGPGCFVGAGAYLRGGVFLDEACCVGPGCEVKSTLVFSGTHIAHFNFVGDSILGANVNIEAGAVIANHRNERTDRRIRIRHAGGVIETGIVKFGSLVGDGARIGANAVIAPGALLLPGTIVPRLGHVDQAPAQAS